MKDAIVFVEADYRNADGKHDRTQVMYYAGPQGGWQTRQDNAKRYTAVGANRIHAQFTKLLGLELVKAVGLPYETQAPAHLAVGWKRVNAQ